MARGSDQSHLYTGVTSVGAASSRTRKSAAKARNERIKQKQEARHRLTREVELPRLMMEFKKEIDRLLYMPYVVGGKKEEELTDEQFRVERRARRIAIERLMAIQIRLTNVMREPVNPTEIAKRQAAEAATVADMDLSTEDFDE